MTRMNRVLKGVAAVSVLAGVVACQGIPQSGSVHAGLDDFVQTSEQVIYRPDMPMPDATQEDIVRGFLLAASSAAEDYTIARQFLSSSYREQWNPYQAVLIDEGQRVFTQSTPNQAKLVLNTIASVSDNGEMVQIAPEKHTEVSFELAREGGQWRIQAAPNGVILDRTTFRDIWSQQQVYFWSKGQALVADPRWFLNRGTITTQIVNELMLGPRDVLLGAVSNAFPAGTLLATETVIVEGGIAHIEVTSEILEADAKDLERISRQLATTLNMVPGVNGFKVTVKQAEVLSGIVAPDQSVQTPSLQEVNQWPAMVKGGDFGYMVQSNFFSDEQLGEQIADLSLRKLIVAGGSDTVIGFGAQGLTLITPDSTTLIDDRSGLLEPSLDDFGFTWSVTSAEPEKMTLIDRLGDKLLIEIPWLKGQNLWGFKVSPDGTKVAFLIEEGEASRVVIAGVVRAEDGTPNHIVDAGEETAFWVASTAIDLDWVDQQRVAVLTKGAPTGTRLIIGGLGIFPEERPGLAGAVSLRGSTRMSLMLLLNDNGELWSPQGSTGWQNQASEVTLLSKRG